MKRFPASVMTVVALFLGISLMVMGFRSGTFGREEYRAFTVFFLYAGFASMLALVLLLGRRADPDYRPFFSSLFGLLATGLVLQGIFFSVMWIFLGQRVYEICMTVLLGLYGLALVMAGAAHHLLAQRLWRPFLYDFFRQLPHIYWRYRI